MQAGVTCTSFSNYTAWKWQLEKKNHDLAPELAAYALTRSFSYASHQCGRDSPTPNCHIYTVTGGSHYYGHLRPAPEGSVRWYAQRLNLMHSCVWLRAVCLVCQWTHNHIGTHEMHDLKHKYTCVECTLYLMNHIRWHNTFMAILTVGNIIWLWMTIWGRSLARRDVCLLVSLLSTWSVSKKRSGYY